MDSLASPQAHDERWLVLYKIGGIAALLAVFVFRRNLGAELSLLAMLRIVHGVPTTPHATAGEWFMLLQDNRLVGLTFLNFFDLFEYALLGLVFLAMLPLSVYSAYAHDVVSAQSNQPQPFAPTAS